MKIHRDVTRKRLLPRGSVVTIGVFDGMHRGHARLVRAVVRQSRRLGVPSVVVTFCPHPVHVLRPKIYCPLIVSLDYRLKILESLGVDHCAVIPFKKSFARLSPRSFIEKYLVRPFSPKLIMVGDDFRFGHSRRGTGEMFRQIGRRRGFDFMAVSTREHGWKRFSSTRIRDFIIRGKLSMAARLLGRPVSIYGRVIHGDARGHRLGYPTANINPVNELLPPSGVYVVLVRYGERVFPGVASIGRRPSFKKICPVNVETHIFNFHQDLYGKCIIVEFLYRIRDEKVFRSAQDLIEQIHKDEQVARFWFARHREIF